MKVRGESEVPSWPGRILSFVIRLIVLAYFIDRLLAWHSFDKFKVTSYATKVRDESDSEKDSTLKAYLNLAHQDFDFMIGFDQIVPEELGHFDFNLLTYGADGTLLELQSIEATECSPEHPGV